MCSILATGFINQQSQVLLICNSAYSDTTDFTCKLDECNTDCCAMSDQVTETVIYTASNGRTMTYVRFQGAQSLLNVKFWIYFPIGTDNGWDWMETIIQPTWAMGYWRSQDFNGVLDPQVKVKATADGVEVAFWCDGGNTEPIYDLRST